MLCLKSGAIHATQLKYYLNLKYENNIFFQKISLAPSSGGESSNRDETESKPFGDATLSVKASLGETAVDFAFAPPLPADDFSEENPIFHLFPIFVLHGNGNVFCLLTG